MAKTNSAVALYKQVGATFAVPLADGQYGAVRVVGVDPNKAGSGLGPRSMSVRSHLPSCAKAVSLKGGTSSFLRALRVPLEKSPVKKSMD
jgi:hypothetical protein